MTEFALGQRWVSQTESALGLGLVTDIDGRRVTVSFPAAEEERTYAMDNAPLARVRYRIGETLEDHDGSRLKVTDVEEQDGLLVYRGDDDQGETRTVSEVTLSPFARFVHPEQRLFCGQFDRNGDFALRYRTMQHWHRLQQSAARGLLGTRTELLPHQIAVADRTARRPAPRVLLADEAGLGKTIEAGLILHRQILAGDAARVLITVPEPLIHQWFVEMLRRFNLHFAIFDQQRLEALEDEGNPFESEQLVLCSLPLLSNHPATLEQARAAGWDMLVVDEAHHLHYSPGNPDADYAAVECLAEDSPGLLLLTATPDQVGLESHFARLRLIDPVRFDDPQRFREEISSHNGLHEQHEVLFRHSREDVGGFPERRVLPAPLRGGDYDNQATLTGSEGLYPEHTLVDDWADDWLELDPRVAWLESKLKELRPEKVLVICAHAGTAQALERHLQLHAGIRSAAFYEQLSIIERDRAAAWFADEEQGAQALICSEIGSEGRNFQFAHHLVLFDLPENPDLLEQRIGRLDRIGQGELIHLHVPYIEDSAQAALFHWYHQGLNAFEQYCPVGVAVHEQVAPQLQQAMNAPEQPIQQLLERTATTRDQMEQQLAEERRTLQATDEQERARAGELIEQIQAEEDSDRLDDYLTALFDQFGVLQEETGRASWYLRPTEHLRVERFPGLSDEGLSVTTDRRTALAREDLAFLSWEHPMVQDAMDLILNSEFGNAALITLSLKGVQPGTLMLESLFAVQCPAPRHLQLGRFLPLNPTRLLLTGDGRDLSDMLSHDKLNEIGGRIKRKNAQQILPRLRDDIEALLPRAQTLAEETLPEAMAQAREALAAHYDGEIETLSQLSILSAEKRDQRIAMLKARRDEGLEAIERAAIRPQGLRVVLTT